LNNSLENFVESGLCELGKILDASDCDDLLKQVNSVHKLSPNIFLTEEEFRKNPQYRYKNPYMGENNLAEKVDLGFIENNPKIQNYLLKVLGPGYNILFKKFIVGVPPQWIPDWVKMNVKDVSMTNLGPYIKPEFSDISYFIGVDFHQDLVDHKNRIPDFVTLYVYLNDVNEDSSPLILSPKSHILGATTFPHDITLSEDKKSITYSNRKGRSEKLLLKPLFGEKGSVSFWTPLILHGTKPMINNKPRISLRYLIEKNPKNMENFLIDEHSKYVEGPLSTSIPRIDVNKEGKFINSKKVLK